MLKEIYSVETVDSKIYVKVLIYNSMLHYPWSYKFVGENSYPVSKDRIKYAKQFQTVQEAEDFIKKIF